MLHSRFSNVFGLLRKAAGLFFLTLRCVAQRSASVLYKPGNCFLHTGQQLPGSSTLTSPWSRETKKKMLSHVVILSDLDSQTLNQALSRYVQIAFSNMHILVALERVRQDAHTTSEE